MCCNASLQVFKLYRLLGEREGGGGGAGGGGQKNRQQVRSQLQRSDKQVFASSQVLGRGGLNHSFGFGAPICPKLPKTYFCAPICQKKPAPNLFLDTYLSKTYFEAPICPKIVLHLIVQNLFWPLICPKLPKTYLKILMAMLKWLQIFCYRMLHGSNELDY